MSSSFSIAFVSFCMCVYYTNKSGDMVHVPAKEDGNQQMSRSAESGVGGVSQTGMPYFDCELACGLINSKCEHDGTLQTRPLSDRCLKQKPNRMGSVLCMLLKREMQGTW